MRAVDPDYIKQETTAPPMPPPPATKLNDWEIDVIEAWAKPMALLPLAPLVAGAADLG